MRYNSETFFSHDEKKKIEAVIKESESKTSGEIVAMVVERSDSYRDIDVFVSMIIASLISIYPAELAFEWADRFIPKIIPCSVGLQKSLTVQNSLQAWLHLSWQQ
jgi:uncharacterized membrane protein